MASYRTIGKYDLDVLFQEVYNQTEKKIIGRILMILGDYLLLETSQLFEVYKRRFSEDLKLTYIKKAVKDLLINEFQYNLSEETEKNVFFYALKKNGGEYILVAGGYKFVTMPYFWATKEKSIILTFNKYLIENNYDEKVSEMFVFLLNKGIFIDNSLENVYFISKIIEEEEVETIVDNYMEQIKPQPILPPNIISISAELEDFGKLTSASDPRVVS